MKRSITSILLFIGIMTCACSTTPKAHLGMSFEEWKNECLMRTWTSGALVGAEDNLEIYQCVRRDIFYYFRDGVLVKVDQGELYKQKLEIKINK